MSNLFPGKNMKNKKMSSDENFPQSANRQYLQSSGNNRNLLFPAVVLAVVLSFYCFIALLNLMYPDRI